MHCLFGVCGNGGAVVGPAQKGPLEITMSQLKLLYALCTLAFKIIYCKREITFKIVVNKGKHRAVNEAGELVNELSCKRI